jgi:hypothetical protein
MKFCNYKQLALYCTFTLPFLSYSHPFHQQKQCFSRVISLQRGSKKGEKNKKRNTWNKKHSKNKRDRKTTSPEFGFNCSE